MLTDTHNQCTVKKNNRQAIEVMRGSASSHINSVKHAFTVVVYGVVAMLEGRNVLAVLGKVRFIAITHDKRYCLQLDSCQENCW